MEAMPRRTRYGMYRLYKLCVATWVIPNKGGPRTVSKFFFEMHTHPRQKEKQAAEATLSAGPPDALHGDREEGGRRDRDRGGGRRRGRRRGRGRPSLPIAPCPPRRGATERGAATETLAVTDIDAVAAAVVVDAARPRPQPLCPSPRRPAPQAAQRRTTARDREGGAAETVALAEVDTVAAAALPPRPHRGAWRRADREGGGAAETIAMAEIDASSVPPSHAKPPPRGARPPVAVVPLKKAAAQEKYLL